VIASLLASACGRPDAPLPDPPAAPPVPERILASATYEPVGVLAGGEWAIANETRGGRTRAVRLRRDGATPVPIDLASATAAPNRALGLTSDGTRVVLATRRPGSSDALAIDLVGGSGAVEAHVALDPGERLVDVAADGQRFWTATRDETGERLTERSLPTGSALSAPAIPSGFDVATIDRRGERVVLRRRIEPGRDEVVLFERGTASATLLLPTDRDGTFVPLALDAPADRLLVAAHEAERAPRLVEIDLGTRVVRTVPGFPCDATAARPLGEGGWLVRRRCEEGVRFDAVGADVELPAPPLSGAAWRGLAPVSGGGWLGAAAAPGAPADLWWIAPSGDRLPLTWGLEPRLDPRSLPRPATVVLREGGHVLAAEHWPASGRPTGSALFLETPTALSAPGAFVAVPSALAASGVESWIVALPPNAEATTALVDGLVATWTGRAEGRRRTLVGGPGDAASAVLERARRAAEPAVVLVAPSSAGIPDPEAPPVPLRAPTTLLVARRNDLAFLGVDAADPRLSVLRAELPTTPGEWPRALLELSLGDPEAP